MRRPSALLAAIVAIAGCAVEMEAVSPEDTLAWRWHPHLGEILVDEGGRTLYVLARDPPGETVCTAECASSWPPALATMGEREPEGFEGRVSAVLRPDGTLQRALDARPLYRYVGDDEPGDANGQGRGGAWSVVRRVDAPATVNAEILDGPGAHAVVATTEAYGNAAGYLARPVEAGSFPGVVMIHEWWGLDDHVRAMARALASHGYLVLAVDLFGTVAQTPERALDQVRGLDPEAAAANLQDAARHLREAWGAPKVGALGWCFGGAQALQLALAAPIDATVVYYGTPVTDPARLAALAGPLFGIFGAEDDSIPPAQARDFDAALAEAGAEREIVLYEGAGHAFANPSGDAYAPEAAMDAWARTLAFLESNLHAPAEAEAPAMV